MKKGNTIILLVVLTTLIGVAIIDAGAERPTDWFISFDQRKKTPYGTYVLHEELGNVLQGERRIRDYSYTIQETVHHLDSLGNYQVGIIEIDRYPFFYEEEVKSIMEYVEKGGEIFLSSYSVPKLLTDTLGVEMINSYTAGLYADYDKSVCSLVGDDYTVVFEKSQSPNFFSHLPAHAKILGYIHMDGHVLPNFVEIPIGKGKVLLHTTPQAFANYNMLREEGYAYATKCINRVKHTDVYWVDVHYHDGQMQTPLRVILQKPGFSQAWYLLLVGLLLLMLFKSRREQRAVEIVLPEPNLSRDFARTIGALYYESGEPGNIIQKKIDYFLFDLRAMFQIDTLDLQNKKMIRLLASKSGVEQQEVTQLMALLVKCQNPNTRHQMDDVKRVNNIIEEFKLKANMI